MKTTTHGKSILTYMSIMLLVLSVFSCGKKAGEIRAGSICTIEDGDGAYGIVKVLVINADEAHVKIYKNKYDQRPLTVDMTTLSMGSITDGNGFGIGHVPLERKGFDDWKPMVVGFEEVTKDDLEGYEFWKNR